MTKIIKITVYILIAYVVINIINSILLSVEFVLVMAPDVVHFSIGSYINIIMWIMIGIHFFISMLAYIYVGIKAPKTNTVIFDVVIVLLPAVFSCLCLTMTNYNIFNFKYLVWVLNSSLGILIMFTYHSLIGYIIAVFPSICIFIGYIIELLGKRRKGNS